MSKYAMEQLKEKLCRELDTIAESRELSSTDLDRAYKLTEAIKNLYKICMLDEGGYSGEGSYAGEYERGSSYRRDSAGRYARDGGYSRAGGYSRGGGYYRDGSYSGGSMEEHLDAMLREARTEEERRAIEDMRRKLS